ncbi:c-di-AMP phosphodiesterase, consists of a GGDEF-like and DHH domains [Paenibacillus sp. UNCCL117]|uniref:DHH family phosphoesterase n=1 Tax=unclassified Paenibacillus TaxID=185978 RepID=UPI000890E242|nr:MULTISPECIES: DHH family phosphoesterase [unclassified Paenibacillus]SDD86194.1 c-di-AMP phosphodiesterase, consists of a GGDEF-like and DHH domains [Paenibacillus sp. cl123]SFW54219.1 c-di-AMP phosphodiesterase, consists of a GGDEF-like and DHH domains [Paenibacillus sp. UNCCL117]
MPKFLLKRWRGLHMYGLLGLLLALIVTVSVFEWRLGVVFLVLAVGAAFLLYRAEQEFSRGLTDYISTLTLRVKKAGSEAMHDLPLGIVLFNEEKVIEWHNPFVARMFGKDTLIGESLPEQFPALKNRKEKELRMEMTQDGRIYEVQIKPEERLLYITDMTALRTLQTQASEEQIAMGIVMMDNLDEATQGLDDQSRSIMMAKVTGEITEWAQKHHLYLRRTASDRYFLVMNQKSLKLLEQSRFEILDEVRDITIENKLPMTLSIGIASGAASLPELGHWAQTSLDMALGRGGDQAAVKMGERLSFYGGRSNAIEKRTRVRARVISHALRDLIRDSDNVLIMGHKLPDMDSVGAAIGVLKMAHVSGKEGYIVLEGINPAIQKLMEAIQEDERLNRWFITPEQALQITGSRSLVVVVDTHRAAMASEPRLLQMTHRRVVIDHHRRSEDFIHDATLVYMEPYASSTCELVTELLPYFNDRLTMGVLEATTLLAGIVVDTRSFSLRTGARTFEAASYLRRNGADSSLIQRLLKEDLDQYIKKSEIIRNAVVIFDHIALAVAEPGRKYSQLNIAQVADTLLTMTGIMASFAISERNDGLIGISARSLGQMNVQVVMERMGGGGHLTNAATQLEGTVAEATQRLKQVLSQIHAEEGLFE